MKSTIKAMLEKASVAESSKAPRLRIKASRATLEYALDKPGIAAPKTLAAYIKATTPHASAVPLHSAEIPGNHESVMSQVSPCTEQFVAAAMIYLERGLPLPPDIPRLAVSRAKWRLDSVDNTSLPSPISGQYVRIRYTADGSLEYRCEWIDVDDWTGEEISRSAWYLARRTHSSITIANDQSCKFGRILGAATATASPRDNQRFGSVPKPSKSRLAVAAYRTQYLPAPLHQGEHDILRPPTSPDYSAGKLAKTLREKDIEAARLRAAISDPQCFADPLQILRARLAYIRNVWARPKSGTIGRMSQGPWIHRVTIPLASH